MGAGIPGGAEAAADLVRGYFCRAEMGTQPDTSPATRFRGSGGPLPPFRCGLERQKNDPMSELTLGGVFFLALNHAYLSNLALCQQLQFVPNCLLSRSSDDISLVAAYGSEQPGTVCQGYIVLPLYDGYL